MWSVITETVRILTESSLYLLIGFALAGVLHVVFDRSDRFSRWLGKRGVRSVVLAAALGAPLPLCSCSVLPAALALRKQGATKGATVSFLISCPETDIVSILMTYGLLGPLMAVFRPLAALVTAIFTGLVMNLVDRLTEPATEESPRQEPGDQCHCQPEPQRSAVRRALDYGFVEFFDDIIGSLVVGILLGGVVGALLPRVGLGEFTGGSFWTMLAMLAIGMPMYVCAAASTPIAVGLIAGGLSPGAALVFLLAGPATNAASVVVLAKHLGRAALAVYLISIAVVSVAMGLALNAIVAAGTTPFLSVVPTMGDMAASPVQIGALIVFAVVTCLSLRRTRALARLAATLSRITGLPLGPRGAKALLLLVALAAYAGSGFAVVRPGERGVITRFGRITQSNLAPGLHYHWPYPIGNRDIAKVSEVKRIELGFRSSRNRQQRSPRPAANADAVIAESWMLTGNEDIIDIKWVVQYRIKDSREALLRYLYGLNDHECLVRDAAEAALRAVVGGRNIDTLLTVDRAEVEAEAKDGFLQPMLDACDAGVEVMSVTLQDVHAPPDVHAAFRDVASAAEDKQTSMRMAEEYLERVTREARGDAATRLAAAEALATELFEQASGEGRAFLDQLAAYQDSPDITRLRVHFETVDAVYGRLPKTINLLPKLDGGLDYWIVPKREAVPVPGLPTEPRPTPPPPQGDR